MYYCEDRRNFIYKNKSSVNKEKNVILQEHSFKFTWKKTIFFLWFELIKPSGIEK